MRREVPLSPRFSCGLDVDLDGSRDSPWGGSGVCRTLGENGRSACPRHHGFQQQQCVWGAAHTPLTSPSDLRQHNAGKQPNSGGGASRSVSEVESIVREACGRQPPRLVFLSVSVEGLGCRGSLRNRRPNNHPTTDGGCWKRGLLSIKTLCLRSTGIPLHRPTEMLHPVLVTTVHGRPRTQRFNGPG
jgi:hypothetical protein